MNQVFIQVRIKEQTEVGEYNDAIYFTQDEYNSPDIQTIIEQEKQRRIQNFVDSVKNPPAEPIVTPEALQAQEEALVDQINMIQTKISEIQVAIAEYGVKETSTKIGKVNG